MDCKDAAELEGDDDVLNRELQAALKKLTEATVQDKVHLKWEEDALSGVEIAEDVVVRDR